MTRVYGEPVNVKDAAGDWTAIDNDLSRTASGDLVNGAGESDLQLPSSLGDGPVTLTHGDDTLALRLQGAGSGAAAVHGATASYPGVAPGVLAKLSSANGGVKEDLVLASAAAQNSFTYDVSLSDGLSLSARKDGGIDVVDGDGDVAFALAAPLAIDAAGDVASGTESSMMVVGDTIVVTLDRGWLSAPGRAFPVVLDPSITPHPTRDCYLDEGNTTTSYCSSADLWAGRQGGKDRKPVLYFDVKGNLPAAANVAGASLNLYPNYQTNPGTAKNLSVHALTSDFDNSATWVKNTASTNWTSAGGDLDSAAIDPQPVPAAGTWSSWDITNLASSWADGSVTNRGLAVTDDGSTADNAVIYASGDSPTANVPYLQVDYFVRTGSPSDATMISQPITSSSTLGINVAGGNVQLSSQDLSVAGTRLPVSIQRFYNSSDPWVGTLGGSGRISLGNDIVLYSIGTKGDRMLVAPGGARFRFKFDSVSGLYTTPSGAGDVTLMDTAGGRHELRDNASGTVYGWYAGAFAYTDDVRDQYGNHLSFTYGGTNNTLSAITDTRGRVFAVTSNSNGFITSITAPATAGSTTPPVPATAAETWQYGYSNGGTGYALTSVTDPESNVTTYSYDPTTKLLTGIHDPRGNDTTIEYDSAARAVRVRRLIDADPTHDIVESLFYSDTAGSACSGVALFGGRTVLTDQNGNITQYCWNTAGAVAKVVNPLGQKSTTTYNPQGNSSNFGTYQGTTGAGTSSIVYDPSGSNPGWNAKTVTDGAGAINSAVYPGSAANKMLGSRPDNVTDPQGKQTNYTWNSQGDMLTSATAPPAATPTAPPSLQASLAYNSKGEVTTATDGKNQVTTYTYNPTTYELSQVTPQPLTPAAGGNAAGSAAMGNTTYTYDGLSRLRTVTDGNGKVITLGYDKLNRNTTIADSDGRTTTIGYDANGNVISRTEGTNTSTYGYDKLNRRTSENFPGSFSNTYTYDAIGNLKTLTDASGTVTYTYEALNRTATIVSPTASGSTDTTAIAYLAPGVTGNPDITHTLTTETLPGNGTVKAVNDQAGKLTSLTVASAGTQTMRRGWTYVTGTTQHELVDTTADYGTATGTTPVTTTTYGYGDNDMLTSAQTVNGLPGGSNVRNDAFAYDKAGNRTSRVTTLGASAPVGTTYSYNADNQLCWQAGSTSNGACNSAPSGATQYTYDAAGNQLTGGAAMTWDAKNRLKTLAGGNVTTLSPGNAEITGVGTSTYQNTVLGTNRTTVGGTLAQIVRDPGTSAAVSQLAGGVKRWFVTDNLGSTIALVDSNGGVQRTYTYDVDGNATTAQAGLANTPATQVTYAGGIDVGNGLMHYGARYYQPASARWTQADPLDQPGDLANANRYLYVGSNPINSIDPSGTLGSKSYWDQKCQAAAAKRTYAQCRKATPSDPTGGLISQYGAYAAGLLLTGACVAVTDGLGATVCKTAAGVTLATLGAPASAK